MNTKTRKQLSAVALLVSALLLDGCVVGPKYTAPQVQAPPAFKETATQLGPDGT